MRMLVEPLGLETPLAAFTGDMFVRPDAGQEVLEEHAERRTVEFTPRVARDLEALLDRPVKLVGVSSARMASPPARSPRTVLRACRGLSPTRGSPASMARCFADPVLCCGLPP
jgi:hypothetical protein